MTPTENLSPSILARSKGIQGVPDYMGCGSLREPESGRKPATGREAALDLIEEHLTDSLFHAGYRVGECGDRRVQGWGFPSDWSGPAPDGGKNFVFKVQPFAQGGYEGTLRAVELPKIGRVLDGSQRPRGKREEPEEQSFDCLIKSAARSKRKVRQLCRNMMASHLVTFTKAEGPLTKHWGPREWLAWDSGGRDRWQADKGAFWTPEQWSDAWDRLRRLLVRVLGHFPYVAILEQHRKGNYHLHVAWVGKVNVGLVRKMWRAVGGSNIDAKYIKVPLGHDRSSRIARYISKYVSKSFEDNPRFNKKRYWASKQTLEDVRRYVLRSLTLEGAMEELRKLMGLDYGKFLVRDSRTGEFKNQNLFMFPDGSGAWINYLPDIHDSGPPF